MSLDKLRQLRARRARPSFLTDEEWAEVFAAMKRGVPPRDIWEAFVKHKGYSNYHSFQNALTWRRQHYPDTAHYRRPQR
jgi:hypothetical protein